MPPDACVYFYRCAACGTTGKPRAGDCCVFCSYGATRWPPMQSPASLTVMPGPGEATGVELPGSGAG